jgi:UDP-glucose 6-dehydrogenase
MRTKNDIETMNILKNIYDDKTKTLNVLYDELENAFMLYNTNENVDDVFFNDIHELCEHVGIDIKNVKTIHVCMFTNNVERVVLNATYRVETKTYTFNTYCNSRDFASAYNMFSRKHLSGIDIDECIINMM